MSDRLLTLALASWIVSGCAAGVPSLPEVAAAWAPPAPPPRPARCAEVPAGDSLATALAAAAPGSAICLAPGEHSGTLTIGEGVVVWGPRSAVIRSAGTGDTVRLIGNGSALLGCTVDGSGSRFDLQEAAIHVESSQGARVEGVLVRNALFGIIVEKSERVVLRGNRVEGSRHPQIGLRGDAIRVWETERSMIEGNLVLGSRDVVIWYSSDNVIRRNEVRDGRYGTHFMYSHGNRVEGNRYVGNVVGVFAMYSRDLVLERNLLAASEGAAGMGLGLKESSAVTVVDNVLVKNSIGIYLDNSPYEPGQSNLFRGNAIRLCDVGVGFHGTSADNHWLDNSLRANSIQVRVDGGGDALGNEWRGNDFDDYAGYDLDRDGVGDVAYELRTFTGTLIARHPQLDFFRGSPALAMIDAASRILPIYRPTTLLVDPEPRTAARSRETTLAD
ncbi:MAG TPA: nitrous oxide reductase family maturation protein NosD [Thermoanaerobaculia bacterium]|nr:nitrous oxide reductase family maturation protein NosD [Thermoanaerobaculia bacterium]